jgi:hypothetical protein
MNPMPRRMPRLLLYPFLLDHQVGELLESTSAIPSLDVSKPRATSSPLSTLAATTIWLIG